MRKLKVLIASMLGAIALVFACVVGTRVNAATQAGTYDLFDSLGSTYNTSNYTPSTNGIFSFTGSFRYAAAGYHSNDKSLGVDTTGFTSELNFRNSRTNSSPSILTITLDLATGQTASVVIKGYAAKDKNLSIGSGSNQKFTEGEVTEFSADLTTGTTNITGSAAMSIVYLVVTVNDSSTKTLSSISASGTTSFYTGDAIPSASDVTVTATYSEGDPVVLSSGYDVTITKKDDTTPISGTFAESGKYIVTASYTYKGVTKTDDYEVEVNDVVKHTVTYYDADMTTSHTVEVNDGESFSESPFKFGCNLVGWASTANATSANVDVSSVTSNLTVYPVFADMCLQLNQNYTFSKTVSSVSTEDTVYYNNTDGAFFIENVLETKDNKTTEKGVFISGTNFSFANSMTANGQGYLGFRIPANSNATITINAKAGSNTDSKHAEIDFNSASNTTGRLTTTDTAYEITVTNDSNDVMLVKAYRSGSTTVTVSNISVSVKANISTTVTATLYKQFDKISNPTMLRLMGKIEGIAYADYSKISNVLMEFDFNDGTNTSSKSAYCYKLYKSINTLDGSLGADEDGKTMYVVLTISGLEKYSSMSFTNVKMTITFSDGSTKEATHTDF